MSPLIISIGSVNIDLVARTQHLPRAGQTVHATGYATGLGGKGANQAAACARLGGSIGIVGRVGHDAFAAQARRSLEGFGVDCSHLVEDPEHPTGLALIGIDAAGENCITVVGGANMVLDTSDLDRADDAIMDAAVMLLQLEIPMDVVMTAACRGQSDGITVILDPAPVPEGGLPDDLWPEITIITPNETEAELLTGHRPSDPQSAAQCAQILHARGTPGVVIKLGGRGAYWSDGTGAGFVPPFTVTAIDTVAAGDCFNAGLALALAEGAGLADATRFACACGALATTKAGAADAAPTRDAVEALLGE